MENKKAKDITKQKFIDRINEILNDYLMDEEETEVIFNMTFYKGDEYQKKYLIWRKEQ